MIGYYNYTVITTFLGFASGMTGIFLACSGKNTMPAVIALLFAGLFDLFDGKIARTKKNRTDGEKAYGIQIDSLSDLVCFGVLPACIGFRMGLRNHFCILLVFYALCALIRLGYYNVSEIDRQATEGEKVRAHYTGLPVTMASLIMPAVYAVCCLFPLPQVGTAVYGTALGLCALAFITPFRLPKPHGKFVYVMAAIGFLLAALVALAWHFEKINLH